MKDKKTAASIMPQALGELELEILQVLWRQPDQDAKTICEQMNSPRSLSTIQSTVERLHKKGLLSRSKLSHAYSYRAQVSRAALLGRLLRDVIQRLHDGRTKTILSSFVNVAASLDEKALDELEQLIEMKRRSEKKLEPSDD